MENSVFRTSSVGEELKQNYIEARLHTDGGPAREANLELQEQLTQSSALPIYVIYEPVARKPIKRVDGLVLEQDFLEFLRTK